MLNRSLLFLVFLALSVLACNLGVSAPITPLPELPAVRFQFPANNSRVVEGTDLQIQLVAEDRGIGIARVQLLIDTIPHQEGTPVESSAVPIFAVDMNWLAQGTGNHTLTAIAFRPDGTSSEEETIIVQVVPDDTATTQP